MSTEIAPATPPVNPPGNRDLLQTESTEIHCYMRANFQLLVYWFTFFCTSNYLGLGWFASLFSSNQLANVMALVVVATLFLVQAALGVVACFVFLKHIDTSTNRLNRIVQAMQVGAHNPGFFPAKAPAVRKFYRRAAYLILGGLGTLIVVWVVLLMIGCGVRLCV